MDDSFELFEDEDLLKKNLSLLDVFSISSDPFEVTTFYENSLLFKLPVFILIAIAFLLCVVCIFILHQLRRNKQICFRTCLLINFFWIKLAYLLKTFIINLIVSSPKKWPSWLNRSAHLLEFYFETMQYVLIFLIWLTLLIDRDLIKLKTLKFNQKNIMTLNAIYEDTQNKEAILEFKLVKNKQALILVCTHFIVLILAFLGSVCLNENKVYGFSKFLSALFEVFFNSFFSQSFLIFSVLLWKFFGGSNDPTRNELSDNELGRIRFIKIASILTSLNESLDLFIYYHNTYSYNRKYSTYIVEIVAHVFTLIISVWFIYSERSIALALWNNRMGLKRTQSFDYILDSANAFVQEEEENRSQI